jgi:hypothetical protein
MSIGPGTIASVAPYLIGLLLATVISVFIVVSVFMKASSKRQQPHQTQYPPSTGWQQPIQTQYPPPIPQPPQPKPTALRLDVLYMAISLAIVIVCLAWMAVRGVWFANTTILLAALAYGIFELIVVLMNATR